MFKSHKARHRRMRPSREKSTKKKQEIKNLVLSQVMYQSRAPDYNVYGSSRPYIIALRLLEAGEC